MFVKTGDQVRIIAGKHRGEEGKVIHTIPSQNKVVVENINIVKKHQRPMGMGQEGGIVEKEAPIDASNVQLIDPETGETTRVGFRVEDGKKVRYSKKTNNPL
ncbi:50S ribosomal protein L24 [Allofustis seminis]|uniref:50S ribosomal protein L24 n=1 Tax=Allofustis seminis TaxID=166939 RepID=UPI000366C125|nr:50S ribosomal protein L24 [Allofustis seminis]